MKNPPTTGGSQRIHRPFSRIGLPGGFVFYLLADFALMAVALLSAYALRFNFDIPETHRELLWTVLPFTLAVEMAALVLCGCYRIVWRYFSATDIPRFAFAFGGASCLFLAMRFGLPFKLSFLYPPISVILINAVVGFCLVLSARFMRRLAAENAGGQPVARRVLIVGAGEAGNALAYVLRHDRDGKRVVVGFLDDSPDRAGAVIQGVGVIGALADAGDVISRTGADEVIVTIGKLSRARLQPLFAAAEKAGARLLVAPDYSRVLDGVAHPEKIREAEIADILRRPEIAAGDLAAQRGLLAGRRVMVTGAGGSIGSEIARQVLAAGPESLILVERSENALFNVCRSLDAVKHGSAAVHPCVADVADEERMRPLFRRFRPEIVIHAAAHKHVPMMEGNVCEAISNNVLGTLFLGRLCCESGVSRFVLLSTDKAVRPSSVMGATKRLCEIFLRGLNGKSATIFSVVRFGNVLGASGSVVPIFREQIQGGGPVTVTHPDMTRYFMTIPEAVHLTLEAASFAKGGEVFILDMGEPVRIVDLAEDMIRLSGHIPDSDIAITFTGIRPGEKLAEELSLASENVVPTAHPQISCGSLALRDDAATTRFEKALREAVAGGDDAIARETLMSIAKECEQ